MYACDLRWWEEYRPEFAGLKVTQDARVSRPDVVRIPSEDKPGLSLDPHRIRQGANGGYQSLNLAVLMGAKKILLLGYDMKADGKKHWHGDHPNGLANPEDVLFEQWRKNFETTLPDLARAGVEVINCTPGSALTCFPRMRLEEAL